MWKSIVRRVLCLPLFLGMIPALFVGLLWGRLYFRDAILFAELKKGSWPNRTWFKSWGGSCFGYGILLAPNQAASTINHELVHTEQQEAGSVVGLLTGIVLAIALGGAWGAVAFAISWICVPWAIYLAGGLVALLRGENFYRGNTNEESAYSQAGQK